MLLSLFILMFKLSLIWPVEFPLNWLLSLLTCPYHFLTISFLIFWPTHKKDVSGLFSTFPALVLESTVFPRSPVPFNGAWYLEINTWCQVYLFLLGIMASRTSQSYGIYEYYIRTCVCVHMYPYPYLCMYLLTYILKTMNS